MKNVYSATDNLYDELVFAIDAAELGVWDLNPLTNTVKVNARLKDWFGLPIAADVPLPLLLNAIADEDRDWVTSAIWQAMRYESGGRYDVSYTIIHPHTGQKRVIRAKGKVQFNEEQVATRFNGIIQDITETKLAEEALRASEAKLRAIVEASPVAIGLYMGRDLVIESANRAFVDIMGKGPGVVGKPLREAMPELQHEQQLFLQLLDDVYTSGQPFHSDASLVQLEQQGVPTPRYYKFTYTPLFNETGTVYAILEVAVDVTGDVHARQRIEESEQRFQNLIRDASVGIIVVNGEEMRVEIVNDAYGQLVERSRETLLGQPLFSVVPEAEATFRPILEQVRRSGEPFYLYGAPYFVWANDVKKEGFLNVVYQPYREHDDTVSGVTVLCQDVTLTVQAQQKIEESEAKFRSLIEEAPVATSLYVGPSQTIEVANDIMLGYWGRDRSVLGQPIARALPELEGQPFLTLLSDIFATGQEHTDRAAPADLIVDGALRRSYFNYTYKPLLNRDGEVYAIMNTAVDVTEQVMAQRKIEEAQNALRAAIELAELSTWEMDINRLTITYSSRFMNWLGLSRETISFDESCRYVAADYRQAMIQAIETSWRPGGTGIYDYEYPITNPHTGQVRIIHAQAQLRHDAAGRPAFLSGTAQDVTEQRRIRQELERQVAERTRQLQSSIHDLERSNLNLQQFAYVASHDLQEPLRKIRSFGNLLADQYGDRLDEGVDLLNRMQAAAGRMSVLIQDLLAFSRISTRQETSSLVNLTDVVQNALLDLDLRIQETGATIDVSPLPTVPGDASQLGQLFQNLLTNALKFSQPGVPPHIQIQAHILTADELPASVRPLRAAANYYRVDVADNGIGFDEKYLDRIFQVFQRLHSKTQYAGTGIGLAICEKVTANHGGAIAAASHPNQGATFSIYLPIETPPAA